MKLFTAVFSGLLILPVFAQEEEVAEAPRVVISTSPDESVGVQASFDMDGTANGDVQLVSLPGRELLLDLSGTFMSGVSVVWAPDSDKVALNGRAGGRYETVMVYARENDEWTEISSPEEATSEALLAAMDAERKAMKIPPNAYDRRIWDTWKLRQWLGDDTAEVLARSIRYDSPRDENGEVLPDEGQEVSVNLRFRLQLHADGTWEILEQTRVPDSEIDGD